MGSFGTTAGVLSSHCSPTEVRPLLRLTHGVDFPFFVTWPKLAPSPPGRRPFFSVWKELAGGQASKSLRHGMEVDSHCSEKGSASARSVAGQLNIQRRLCLTPTATFCYGDDNLLLQADLLQMGRSWHSHSVHHSVNHGMRARTSNFRLHRRVLQFEGHVLYSLQYFFATVPRPLCSKQLKPSNTVYLPHCHVHPLNILILLTKKKHML